MASTTPSDSDSWPVHDASQYIVEGEKYDTLLQRWKEEQQMRLKAEQELAKTQSAVGTLRAHIFRLESKLRSFEAAAQQLRALL